MSSLGFKTSQTIWQNLGHETRTHAKQRREVERFAHKVGRAVARRKPRLVKPDAPALQVFTLQQFLQSQPVVSSELTELVDVPVRTLDRRDVVGAQL